jgi:2-haloacid dehalogenase
MPAPRVRALFFDVFGTLFDWRTSLIRSLNAFGERTGTACDWEALVDAWRGAYVPSMARVRARELAADDRAWIVRRWHALDPWPDVAVGLARLRDRYVLSTLSNGSVALLVALARRADLRFDTILCAESFRHYKPDPETYLGAAAMLGYEPREAMLVAAHNDDLQAAASLGFRTAFVARPTEYGPHQNKDFAASDGIDIAVTDLIELADVLAHG